MKFLLTVGFLLMSVSSYADVIYMKNGDRITGEIKQVWDDSIDIEPSYTDTYSIDLVDVESFETDGEFDLELEDGRDGDFLITRSVAPGEIVIAADGSTETLSLTNLRRLSEIEDFFEWDAKLDANQSFSEGNNDSYIGNFNGELELKWGDHRTLYTASNTTEEVEEVTTKDQTRFNASYNYLFGENWFLAANLSWEEDPIALLDSRVSVNPGIGYDIFDNPGLVLNVQLGAGYQTEDIDNTTDESMILDWRLRYSQDFFGGDVELFHNHQIYQTMQGRENTVLNTQTGLRYDITDDIFLNTQLNYDFDSAPAGDTEKEDLTFVVGAGISF